MPATQAAILSLVTIHSCGSGSVSRSQRYGASTGIRPTAPAPSAAAIPRGSATITLPVTDEKLPIATSETFLGVKGAGGVGGVVGAGGRLNEACTAAFESIDNLKKRFTPVRFSTYSGNARGAVESRNVTGAAAYNPSLISAAYGF